MNSVAEELREHEYFRELAALSATGQLSPQEHAELEAHLYSCAECLEDHIALNNIVRGQFPLIYPLKGSPKKDILNSLAGNSYKKRFFARARAEGVELGHSESVSQDFWKKTGPFALTRSFYAYSVVAVLLACVGTLGYRRYETEAAISRSQNARIARLNDENSALREKMLESANKADSTQTKLAGDLSRAQREQATLSARYNTLARQLEDAKDLAKNLKAEAVSQSEDDKQTNLKLQQSETKVNQLSEQLQALRSNGNQQLTSASEQEHRVSELEKSLIDTKDSLDRAQRLLTADHDIRDLMGARSLHITDVYDVDGKGKSRRSFGRVFYTEGRSLIFYAFDLGNPKSPVTKHSYQVWGYQEAANRPALNLGIMYLDDRAQNRWTLKFDDPAVLSDIDAVFVTVEPPGGSVKPTGQKLLYAFLVGNANHP